METSEQSSAAATATPETSGLFTRRKLALVSLAVALLAFYAAYPRCCRADGGGGSNGAGFGMDTQKQQQQQDLYSVVFDAGSTGSRMFVFHFKLKNQDGLDGESVLLEHEVFESIEPGISSYSQKPSQAADSLAPLLHKAVSSVPAGCQNATLVTLKATAGLRLLPKEKGDQIMDEVRDLIKSSPFLLPDPNKIMVMGGEEEGLFAWVTVNFLLDVLWDDDSDNTVATFDLGGGSMQITFELSDDADLSDIKVKELFKLKLLQAYFLVFTYSYLGSGLKSGRLGIMGRGEGHFANIEQKTAKDDTLSSPCFPESFNMTWSHGESNYLVKGTSRSSSSLKPCQVAVDQWVRKANFIKNKQLHQRELHLFSYFFDVAKWAGIIPPDDIHKILTPADFLKAAEHHCVSDNISKSFPFMCMDLLYIHSMLTEGFGFAADRKMHVEKKIVGREVSWSLGAALSTLSRKFTYSTLHL